MAPGYFLLLIRFCCLFTATMVHLARLGTLVIHCLPTRGHYATCTQNDFKLSKEKQQKNNKEKQKKRVHLLE